MEDLDEPKECVIVPISRKERPEVGYAETVAERARPIYLYMWLCPALGWKTFAR